MRLVLVVALLSLASIVGCSGDDESPKPQPIPIDQLSAEFESANCDFEVRCTWMPDKATCTKLDGPEYELLQLVSDAVTGKVHYDPAAGRAWVEAVRTQGCEYTLAVTKKLEAAWEPVFVGSVPLGGPCAVDDECTGTNACDRSECGNEACCAGACTAKPAHVPLGGDCTTETCEDDAYCSDGTDGAGGEGGGGGGGPSTPTCKPRADNGAPCKDQGGCADGQLCGNGKCYKLSTSGQACNPSLPISCLEYDEWCDAMASKCVKLPAVGEPCGTNGAGCRLYTGCSANVCKTFPVEGESCQKDATPCLGDLECDGTACAKRPAVEVCAELNPPSGGGGGGMGGGG